MSTLKFSGPSPYELNITYPEVDNRHSDYLNNVSINHSSKSQAKPVVAAIFGLGRAGSIHLNNIIRNPRVVLKYIVDDRPEKFEDLRKYWKLTDDVTFLTSKDASQVYNDKRVNVVVIVTPTFTHRDIILNAIANDKHVFCEKPITENVEDTKKCYEAAKAKNCILLAAFNHRFDPAFWALKEKVRKGDVGHVQILKITSRDSPRPSIEFLKTSGGAFQDYLVHDLDISCWILGELPCRVQVSASALVPELKAIGDFDTIAYLLTFPSGAVVLGDYSRFSSYGFDSRLEAFGNKGMIKVENELPLHSIQHFDGQSGVKTNPIFHSWSSRYHASYGRELEHFLDVVQDAVPIVVTSWQTLAVSKLATAAEQSARTGKSVDIDWSSDDIPSNYS